MPDHYNQWRASRALARLRFPCIRDVPDGLPPVETWPYYANAVRLRKDPSLLGSLECQYTGAIPAGPAVAGEMCRLDQAHEPFPPRL